MKFVFFTNSEFITPLLSQIASSNNQCTKDLFKQQIGYLNNFQSKIEPIWWLKSEVQNLLLESIDSEDKIEFKGIVTGLEKVNRNKIIPNLITQWGNKNGIKIFKSQKINHEITNFQAEFEEKLDFCLLASFGQMLSNSVLDIPKYGFINWHPSNLPAYRGSSPMQSVILNGDNETALSWLEMTKEMDAGDIWLKLYSTLNNDDIDTLTNKMIDFAQNTWLLPLVVKKWYSNQNKTPC
jgi:methionyl-tRNA formyltransferase